MAEVVTNSPAYLSYATFKSAIQGLAREGTIPKQIDHSVLGNLSGSVRKMFLAALRFFELIDDAGTPSDRLRKMAFAEDPEWKEHLKYLIMTFYPNQVPHLADGSPQLLREKFTGIGTSIVAPAMRFLVSAARDAGIPVSPHIAQRGSAFGGGGRRRLRKLPKQNVIDEQEDLAPAEPPATSLAMALLDKFPPFDPTWGPEQQKAWFSAYEKLLSMNQEANESRRV